MARKRKQNSNGTTTVEQSELPLAGKENGKLEITALENWLWDAACTIRGATDAPKFKDFILPLIFYKRLSDVFDDEFAQYVEEYGDEAIAREIIEADHADALASNRKPIIRFLIPAQYSWEKIRGHGADGKLGEFITEAMTEVARLNPELDGVIGANVLDYNARQSGQRLLDDDRLEALIEVISRHRLGLKDTEPDVLGQAYEYLLRKFAEGQGQSAGEFLTPPEVGWMMAEILDPEPYSEVYDPTCGTTRLLIKPRLVFEKKHPDRKGVPKLYGQERTPATFAIGKMNLFLHDFMDSQLAIGDTFINPVFTVGNRLRQFEYAIANPMWNQNQYDDDFYENDSWERFENGKPPRSSADWGWVQHIFASLKDRGQAAIVLDTGAVSRGAGSKSSNKEKKVRENFVENDWVEGVILLPENLFYNTTAPGIVLLLNRSKPEEHCQQFLLVNASAYFVKVGAKNRLTDAGKDAVVEVYQNWETRDKLSRVVSLEDVQGADYNLSPSQFVEINDKLKHRPLKDILKDLEEAKKAREKADRDLADVLAKLGLKVSTDETAN